MLEDIKKSLQKACELLKEENIEWAVAELEANAENIETKLEEDKVIAEEKAKEEAKVVAEEANLQEEVAKMKATIEKYADLFVTSESLKELVDELKAVSSKVTKMEAQETAVSKQTVWAEVKKDAVPYSKTDALMFA